MIKQVATKNIIWIALFSILFGCNNYYTKIADTNFSSDSTKHITEKENLTPEKKIIEKSLIGRWCSLNDSESLFQVDKKEIFITMQIADISILLKETYSKSNMMIMFLKVK